MEKDRRAVDVPFFDTAPMSTQQRDATVAVTREWGNSDNGEGKGKRRECDRVAEFLPKSGNLRG